MKILLSAIIILFSLSGCLTMDENNNTLPEGLTMCGEERPTRCTREYAPVCGYSAETGEWKNYPNKCEACRDSAVTGYISGSCGGEGKKSKPAAY